MKIEPQYVTIGNEQIVMLAAKDYERLAKLADMWEPPMPELNEHGNYPVEVLGIIIAKGILRDRRKLGLTQAELARRAGIRPQTLNRIEHGMHSPNVRTMEKIDGALKAAEKEKRSA